jgi:hypothetical protein
MSNRSIRVGLRRRLAVLASGILVFSLAAGAGTVSAAQAAARSTDVRLINLTGCDLTRFDYGLDHGEWTNEPPWLIIASQIGSWESESNGFMTGTEGHAAFLTSDCTNRALRHKVIRVYWDNPYVGSNSYDYNGTDPAFRVPRVGGGGDNASVTFYAERN